MSILRIQVHPDPDPQPWTKVYENKYASLIKNLSEIQDHLLIRPVIRRNFFNVGNELKLLCSVL
jgi:hypothetical protein